MYSNLKWKNMNVAEADISKHHIFLTILVWHLHKKHETSWHFSLWGSTRKVVTQHTTFASILYPSNKLTQCESPHDSNSTWVSTKYVSPCPIKYNQHPCPPAHLFAENERNDLSYSGFFSLEANSEGKLWLPCINRVPKPLCASTHWNPISREFSCSLFTT